MVKGAGGHQHANARDLPGIRRMRITPDEGHTKRAQRRRVQNFPLDGSKPTEKKELGRAKALCGSVTAKYVLSAV